MKLAKKLKSIFIKVGFASILVLPILLPVTAYAETSGFTGADSVKPTDNVCQGASNLQFGGESGADCSTATGEAQTTVNTLIATIINIFSVIVGVVAVIMMIYGGFKYITSGGDSGNITTAKNTILYAIIGLVIVAVAQLIVRFVLARATNVTQ